MTDGNMFDAGSQPADVTDVLAFGAPDRGPAAPRRRGRAMAVAAVAAAAAIAIVAVALSVGSSGPAATPEQELAAASRAAATLNSESATLTEEAGSLGSIHGTYTERRSPFLEAMVMTENFDGQPVALSMIATRTDAYIKLRSAAHLPGVPAGRWIKMPLTGSGNGSAMASMMQNLSGQTPMSQLRMLTGADHLRADGTAIVGGVLTTKFSGSLDPKTADKHLPASMASALQLMNGDIGFSVWIDGSHRIRKITETASINSVISHVTMTFYGFNQPVRIQLPKASQVVSPPAGLFGS